MTQAEPVAGRQAVEADPSDLEIPVAHLLPVLAALVDAGARIRYRTDMFGFHPARDGWRCELLDPLDADLVEKLFVLPPTVRLDRAAGRLDDSRNHVMIVGRGATAAEGSPG